MIKSTVGDLLLKRVKLSGEKNSIGKIEKKKIKFLSFNNYKTNIETCSMGLQSLGLKQKDKVAILSQTRIEWNLIDISIMSIGSITVPVYPSYTASEIEHILNHSEASFLILENEEQLQKIQNIYKDLKFLKTIITIDEISKPILFDKEIQVLNYEKFFDIGTTERENAPDQFNFSIQNVAEEDVATIVYTSGTTGLPKGAIITQKALVKVLHNIKKYSNNSFDHQDRFLTFLPLSHVLGRCESLFPLIFGSQAVYAESIDRILPNILLVRPTLMVAVPRIFEKIYEKVQKSLDASEIKKVLFEQSLKSAESYFSKIDNDRTPNTAELLKYQLAKKLVFDKVYKQFGGRIRFFISGGAPLNTEVIKFLRACNLTILEGYGLTETIAPCAVNPMDRQIPGTVGRPIGDVQVKFSEDEEILIKSEALFSGYYKNDTATAEVLDQDGWFHTGDLGKFTQGGFLQITGRKKDIIITSGGKNVAPQKIEGELNLSPLIAQSVIIGDQKKFLTALIFIDKDGIIGKELSSDINEDTEIEDISKNKDVYNAIRTEIEKINHNLASFETIKKFTLIGVELTTDNYLTPSLKIKKKLVKESFTGQIEAMYQ